MRIRTAILFIFGFLLVNSSFTVAGMVKGITLVSARTVDSGAGSSDMLDSSASDPSFPILGVKVRMFGASVQYVNSSDYFYVNHGFSSDVNWSSLSADVQSAFLDPAQTNFTLQTSAPNFQNPLMTHYTEYDSALDVMYTWFFFQFYPGDLAPGNYTFTGTWSISAAADAPNYTPAQSERTITLVVNSYGSSTLISCSPNPVPIFQHVNCTATVSGSDPTGTVTWSTSSIGGSFSQFVCLLSNGTCSTLYNDNFTGSATIVASYSGDSSNPPSSSSTTLTVTSGGPVYYSQNYTSVQATINAAPSGATVIIAPGFYTESLTINETLTIIGERDTPVFSGGTSAIYLTLLSGASGSTITGIEVTNFAEGILIDNASNCRIYGNIMASIGSSGIVLDGNSATGNAVFDNTFQDTPTPINLTGFAGGNTIYGNIITSQTSVTLNIGSDRNVVYGNSMTGSQLALNVTNSNSNLFYHNNFLATTQLTVLTTGDNTWSNGYPSGGNYWSDYLTKYPNATETDDSGIWNTPYIIDGNNTDHYPLMKPWTAKSGHCVAVISVVAAKTVIGQGFGCNVTVDVADEGEYNESFSVAAYANTIGIGTQQVSSLNSSCQMVLNFAWSTAGLTYGSYTISAYAQPVAGQTDRSGIDFTLGTAKVTIPGDINGDFHVSLADLVLLANAYGSHPNQAKWNPNADINGNGVVGLSDLVLLANHYGQHNP